MEKTCKTCINLCNKRGEVEGCRKHRSEVQEMIKEIDKKLTVEEAVRIIQEEGYLDFERNEIGGIDLEEDIKILEEMLSSKEPVCNYKLKHQEIEAISNLLTRYKQLEEENKRLNNHNIIGRIDAIKIEDLEPVLKPYYIPKSKVKEKIEEYDKQIKKLENKKVWNEPADTIIRNRLCNYYNALQELLREE